MSWYSAARTPYCQQKWVRRKTGNQWESEHDLNNLRPVLNIPRPASWPGPLGIKFMIGLWQSLAESGRQGNFKCLPCLPARSGLCTFYGRSPVFYVKLKCFNCSRNRKNKQISGICGITDNFLLLGITNFN